MRILNISIANQKKIETHAPLGAIYLFIIFEKWKSTTTVAAASCILNNFLQELETEKIYFKSHNFIYIQKNFAYTRLRKWAAKNLEEKQFLVFIKQHNARSKQI